MRRGDCCQLKWADVDMQGQNPSITVKTSKTGETVCIPIYEALMRELGLAQRRWDGMTGRNWEKQRFIVAGMVRQAKEWVDGRVLREVPATA